MPKISTYPNNSSPDNAFMFVGTDPLNSEEGPSGTTETVTLETLLGFSLPLPTGGTYPGGTTEFLRADQTWAVPPGTGGGSTVWHDLVGTYGADPTGSTSCSTALATACTAAVAAQPAPFGLTVPPGYYKVTAPQQLPYNLILQGAGAQGGDVTDQFVGTWFRVASSFSGGSYVFGCSDNADHSSAVGALCSGFGVDGSAYTAEAVNGFLITGPTMCTFSDLVIAQMSGWAVMTGIDASSSEIGPYGQSWTRVTANSNGTVTGGGFYLEWCEDSVFTDVYALGNNDGPGFYITECDNAKFTACNAEWSEGASGYGFYVTGDWQWATGGCLLTGCSTDANAVAGLCIDATWTTGGGAGTGPGIIMVTGCHFRRDGQGSGAGTGNTAGILLGATTLPIIITGFSTMPSIGDGGSGTMAPEYGIFCTQDSYSQPILISNGLAWGYTHPTYFSGGGSPSGTNFPTGVTSASILLAHGNNYAPTYGS